MRESVPDRLFTYGSLMPGKSYAHLLDPAPGDWQPASVTGVVDANGWGHSTGYPALLLDPRGSPIEGMVLHSTALDRVWKILDEFEGAAYERVITEAVLRDGSRVATYVYALHHSLQPPIRARLQLA